MHKSYTRSNIFIYQLNYLINYSIRYGQIYCNLRQCSFRHFSLRSMQSCVQFPTISVIARLHAWRKCAAIFHEKTDINVERVQGYNFNRGCGVNCKKIRYEEFDVRILPRRRKQIERLVRVRIL